MRLCVQCRLGAHDHCVCTDCDMCAHRFDHETRKKTLEEVEKALERLLCKPINLIPMKLTKAKETRDDIYDGMSRALRVIREMRR